MADLMAKKQMLKRFEMENENFCQPERRHPACVERKASINVNIYSVEILTTTRRQDACAPV